MTNPKIIMIDGARTYGYGRAVKLLGGQVVGSTRVTAINSAVSRGNADVLLIGGGLIARDDWSYADLPIPVIVLDPSDGSQIYARFQVQWPSVKAVLKRTVLNPLSRHNEFANAYHMKLLTEAGVKASAPLEPWQLRLPLQLPDADLAKLYPLVGFASHSRINRLADRDINFTGRRKRSAHYAGFMEYSGTTIQSHRAAALLAAERSPGSPVACKGRRLDIRRYTTTMLNSSCVVSPWGWGETTIRDFEAMFCGAVLIKPTMQHVATWPENLFVPGETFVECGMMFEDVPEIVERVRRDWPQYRKMRQTARRRAMAARDPEQIAARLKQILEEVL